jgi:SM-20-related protein
MAHGGKHNIGGFAALARGLSETGYAVLDRFLDEAERAALEQVCRQRAAEGRLEPAAIGRAASRRRQPELRGDRICWLDAASSVAAEVALLDRFEALRELFNQALWLNLAECEAHYALYPPGARYALHHDTFRDDDRRIVSLVCYLNAQWSADDGGALRVRLDRGAGRLDVLPLGGRLVAFLSAEFEHEVLPARRERLSIAAWLRRR